MEFLLLMTKASDNMKGFDWLKVCNNPLVRNYITQQYDILVTSDDLRVCSESERSEGKSAK
jgi:hypothetical protein